MRTKLCPICEGDGKCNRCYGVGCEWCDFTSKCPTCDGSGRVPVTQLKDKTARRIIKLTTSRWLPTIIGRSHWWHSLYYRACDIIIKAKR